MILRGRWYSRFEPANGLFHRSSILRLAALGRIHKQRSDRRSRNLEVARLERWPHGHAPESAIGRLSVPGIACPDIRDGIARILLRSHPEQNITHSVVAPWNALVFQRPLAVVLQERSDFPQLFRGNLLVDTKTS